MITDTDRARAVRAGALRALGPGRHRFAARPLRISSVAAALTVATAGMIAAEWNKMSPHLAIATCVQATAISVVGVRLVSYYHSFLMHWRRYRHQGPVSTAELREFDVPFLRLHVTTRGLFGSTEVILRGIRNVSALVAEDPAFYRHLITVEICTESPRQASLIRQYLSEVPEIVPVEVLVLPADYRTPAGTEKKARSLHYVAELRRSGWGRRPGRTFVVHYDEESVIEPAELRKLLFRLALTDKKVLEGPIYYPLEYLSTSVLCRTMEANRPIGCFECRSVMESGIPLHLHGSNLVVEEQFENELGWDMGTLDGQPFIAEDYVFGVLAFLKGGREVFGWHGAVMLEQPPFSYRSAFKQRQRWITGVLQGQDMLLRMEGYWLLPRQVRTQLIWGTRFRVFSFAVGAPVGLMFLSYVVLGVAGVFPAAWDDGMASSLPVPLTAWLSVTGLMWLGAVFIGSWMNLAHANISRVGRMTEIGKALTLAPLAGILESVAGLWAVVLWLCGRREVSWQPTPKTRQADQQMDWGHA
jgi:hypothetical protein